MTRIQRMAVGNLFFLFGNGGPKYTKGNHHFLSTKLYGGEDDNEMLWQPTDECKDAFEKVMGGDWSLLSPRTVEKLQKEQEDEERLAKAAGVDDE